MKRPAGTARGDGSAGVSPAGARRRLCAAIGTVPLMLVLVVGCCGPAPLAERYFDREEPLGAIKGFAYAIEARQWDYAYASLTKSTREEIGPLKFRAAIGFLRDPIGEVSIYELVTNVYVWAPLSQSESQALVRIVSMGRRDDGRLLVRALDIELSYEDEEWRMDLLATAEALAGRVASWQVQGASDLLALGDSLGR